MVDIVSPMDYVSPFLLLTLVWRSLGGGDFACAEVFVDIEKTLKLTIVIMSLVATQIV